MTVRLTSETRTYLITGIGVFVAFLLALLFYTERLESIEIKHQQEIERINQKYNAYISSVGLRRKSDSTEIYKIRLAERVRSEKEIKRYKEYLKRQIQ